MPAARRWQAISGPASAHVFVAPMDPEHRQAIALRTEIPNAFGEGTIGHLYVVLDFGAFQNVLDQAVEDGPRNLLILDSRGYVIGASRELRERLDISALRSGRLEDAQGGRDLLCSRRQRVRRERVAGGRGGIEPIPASARGWAGAS